MRQETNKPQTIIILGAGLAGFRAAIDLADRLGRRNDIRLILVDHQNHHIFSESLLDLVATDRSSLEAGFSISQALQNKPIEFWQDWVTEINPINQTINLAKQGTVPYSYLVVGLGSTTRSVALPGLADHAWPIHSLTDVLQLRTSLDHHLKTNKTTKVIVGGGGPAGIELAGALASPRRLKQGLELTIIEQNSQILSGYSRQLIAKVKANFKTRSIELYPGHQITKIGSKRLTLASNHHLPFDFLIWAGGPQKANFSGKEHFTVNKVGQITVNHYLQAQGYSRVYVVGDLAHQANDQQTTNSAVETAAEGAWAALNISRLIRNYKPLVFRPKHGRRLIQLNNQVGLLQIGSTVLTVPAFRSVQLWRQLWYYATLTPFVQAWQLSFKKSG